MVLIVMPLDDELERCNHSVLAKNSSAQYVKVNPLGVKFLGLNKMI
jgi:hypothetical protein